MCLHETGAVGFRVGAVKVFVIRKGQTVDKEIEFAPLFFGGLDELLNGLVVADIALLDDTRPHFVSQFADIGLEASFGFGKVGESQLRTQLVKFFNNGPCDAALIAHAEDQSPFSGKINHGFLIWLNLTFVCCWLHILQVVPEGAKCHA